MMVYTLLILIPVSVLLLLIVQPSGTIYIRLLSIPVLCIIFTACLILFTDTAAKSALNGLNLWAAVVVPSLFPFFVASEMLSRSGFARLTGKLLESVMRPVFNVPGCSSLALALGITSGYPVGAKITSDLRKSNALTRTEAERLLAFTNNSGPLFITGAVGTGMLGSASAGMFLYICHILACIAVGIVFRFYKRSEKMSSKPSDRFLSRLATREPGRHTFQKTCSDAREKCKNPFADLKGKLFLHGNTRQDLGTLLGEAVRNSVSTILSIGGFIVLFSVIISFLEETGIIRMATAAVLSFLPPGGLQWDIESVISGVLSGILEITNGTGTVSSSAPVPLCVKLPAISFIIGWAGFSVHLQVMSIVSETDIGVKPYLAGKLLQGIAGAAFTWAGLKLFTIDGMFRQPVLSLPGFNMLSFFQTMGRSVYTLIMIMAMWYGIIKLMRLGLAMKKKSSI